MPGPTYPTAAHAGAADDVATFFAADPRTDAVLVTNSCARGKATPDSCLDVQVIAREPDDLQRDWDDHAAGSAAIASLRAAGRFSELHLDVTDARFPIQRPVDEGRLDMLEVAVGNLLVYAAPLWSTGSRLDDLRAVWLPFYDDHLRAKRLAAVVEYALHDLDHIGPNLERGLYFQSFARLYRAFQAFLMALHIERRTYPISYDKWIQEQVAENLVLPELYARLPSILEVSGLESRELERNAAQLRGLFEEYVR